MKPEKLFAFTVIALSAVAVAGAQQKPILPEIVSVEISIPVGQEIGCFVNEKSAKNVVSAIAVDGNKSFVLNVKDSDISDGKPYFFAMPPKEMGAGDYTVLAKYDGKWHEDCAARIR